jgi:hypothetical protein
MAASQPHFSDDVDDEDIDRPGDWPWAAVVASICALMIAVPYWATDYADVEDGALGTFALPVILILGFAALLVIGLHLGSKLETAIALCIPAPAAVIGRVLIDTADDPTTHGLWPVEVAVAVGLSVPPVLAGILLGWAVRRAIVRSRSTEPQS